MSNHGSDKRDQNHASIVIIMYYRNALSRTHTTEMWITVLEGWTQKRACHWLITYLTSDIAGVLVFAILSYEPLIECVTFSPTIAELPDNGLCGSILLLTHSRPQGSQVTLTGELKFWDRQSREARLKVEGGDRGCLNISLLTIATQGTVLGRIVNTDRG